MLAEREIMRKKTDDLIHSTMTEDKVCCDKVFICSDILERMLWDNSVCKQVWRDCRRCEAERVISPE